MQYFDIAPHVERAAKYDFISETSPGVWKICRKNDRTEFLAHDVTAKLTVDPFQTGVATETDLQFLLQDEFTNLWDTLERILNHENLVSIVDAFFVQKSDAGGRPRLAYYIVWDFCNAGNLGNLLVPDTNRHYYTRKVKDPWGPPPTDEELIEAGNSPPPHWVDGHPAPLIPIVPESHLPESLCWHVLLSLLRGLAWLHDGTFGIERSPDPESRAYIVIPDQNWEPILHRNITPMNIFFQHPVRDEWYGECKLGNYSSAFISNHFPDGQNNPRRPHHRGKALAPPLGKSFQPLEELARLDDKYGYTMPLQEDQPYTIISEWRALAEVLLRMMDKKLKTYDSLKPDLDYILERVDYTDALKNIVILMATYNPDVQSEENPFRFVNQDCLTSELLLLVHNQWRAWKESEHPEAKRLVTKDTGHIQQSIEIIERENQKGRSAKIVQENLEKQDKLFEEQGIEQDPWDFLNHDL
ncbi:uncharacterized protein F4822DRAFT_430160 [Hypoxylon trugodes]|uniref:uncharacterized protein n=1 Tax=Hypoxylon trugodes TaxID=326681 RepID=UPI00219EEADA|nr:uncharacterized protein F4822DRAFT_430160 [Hypoxylon trugodes]KAI1387414.1 hypothetical protein F4822DRAFT_430160 [Hypoxylon trugodes]